MKAVHTSSPLTFTPEKSENVLLNKLYPHHVLALEGLGLSSRKIYPTFGIGISPCARRQAMLERKNLAKAEAESTDERLNAIVTKNQEKDTITS